MHKACALRVTSSTLAHNRNLCRSGQAGLCTYGHRKERPADVCCGARDGRASRRFRRRKPSLSCDRDCRFQRRSCNVTMACRGLRCARASRRFCRRKFRHAATSCEVHNGLELRVRESDGPQLSFAPNHSSRLVQMLKQLGFFATA